MGLTPPAAPPIDPSALPHRPRVRVSCGGGKPEQGSPAFPSDPLAVSPSTPLLSLAGLVPAVLAEEGKLGSTAITSHLLVPHRALPSPLTSSCQIAPCSPLTIPTNPVAPSRRPCARVVRQGDAHARNLPTHLLPTSAVAVALVDPCALLRRPCVRVVCRGRPEHGSSVLSTCHSSVSPSCSLPDPPSSPLPISRSTFG